MRADSRLIAAVVAVALLSACPPPRYGIHRGGELAVLPDPKCVRELLEARAEPNSFGYERTESGSTETVRIEYISADTEYSLHFTGESGKPSHYYHDGLAERDTPAETLRMIRADMREVGALLQDTCGATDLVARTTERCEGEHCKEIE